MLTTAAELIRNVDGLLPRVIAWRQQLHAMPEASHQEHQTAALIADALRGLGLQPRTGIGGTGVVADVGAADAAGPFLALRADIDALPIVEEPCGRPYASTRPGFAHSCGHDGHAAALLGVAALLQGRRDSLKGCVRLVFQPAEETISGARAMLADGLFADRLPQAIIACHGWPGMPLGSVGALPGVNMAANDTFEIIVHGRGGHGARPERARNPLRGAARIIEAVQQMIVPGRQVVSVCTVHGGSKCNIIPPTAVLGGTMRTIGPDTRSLALARFEQACAAACAEVDTSAAIRIFNSCPMVINDPGLCDTLSAVVAGLAPEVKWQPLDGPTMGSEDFSLFLEAGIPSLFFRVGTGTDSPELHHPAFDFPDPALRAAMLAMAGMALAAAAERAG